MKIIKETRCVLKPMEKYSWCGRSEKDIDAKKELTFNSESFFMSLMHPIKYKCCKDCASKIMVLIKGRFIV